MIKNLFEKAIKDYYYYYYVWPIILGEIGTRLFEIVAIIKLKEINYNNVRSIREPVIKYTDLYLYS